MHRSEYRRLADPTPLLNIMRLLLLAPAVSVASGVLLALLIPVGQVTPEQLGSVLVATTALVGATYCFRASHMSEGRTSKFVVGRLGALGLRETTLRMVTRMSAYALAFVWLQATFLYFLEDILLLSPLHTAATVVWLWVTAWPFAAIHVAARTDRPLRPTLWALLPGEALWRILPKAPRLVLFLLPGAVIGGAMLAFDQLFDASLLIYWVFLPLWGIAVVGWLVTGVLALKERISAQLSDNRAIAHALEAADLDRTTVTSTLAALRTERGFFEFFHHARTHQLVDTRNRAVFEAYDRALRSAERDTAFEHTSLLPPTSEAADELGRLLEESRRDKDFQPPSASLLERSGQRGGPRERDPAPAP